MKQHIIDDGISDGVVWSHKTNKGLIKEFFKEGGKITDEYGPAWYDELPIYNIGLTNRRGLLDPSLFHIHADDTKYLYINDIEYVVFCSIDHPNINSTTILIVPTELKKTYGEIDLNTPWDHELCSTSCLCILTAKYCCQRKKKHKNSSVSVRVPLSTMYLNRSEIFMLSLMHLLKRQGIPDTNIRYLGKTFDKIIAEIGDNVVHISDLPVGANA